MTMLVGEEQKTLNRLHERDYWKELDEKMYQEYKAMLERDECPFSCIESALVTMFYVNDNGRFSVIEEELSWLKDNTPLPFIDNEKDLYDLLDAFDYEYPFLEAYK